MCGHELPGPSENQAINTQAFCRGTESGAFPSEFSNKSHVLSRLEKSMLFGMDAIFGELGPKKPCRLAFVTTTFVSR